ncbi:MAG TPA: hypothetical protein PLU72_02000 [Candidatus Ozemobacteraceae bacterium]|nr:hypothetical protein [Candidatus Ozemobacteraceae bacterium]
MQETIKKIKDALQLIDELKRQFAVRRHPDGCGSLLYTGVAESNVIEKLQPVVEKRFGPAYKPAGQSALLKNWFDGFVKGVGGIRRDQTLFRLDITPELIMFCAFWPWGSEPVKTSIRIGLMCSDEDLEKKMETMLQGCF